jgi:phosphoglucomutase
MSVTLNPLAGHPVPARMLANIPRLVSAYFTNRPDPAIAGQRVAFGTSGHRGNALDTSFNEAHILAISQAICEYRHGQGVTGPLFLGADTHALSEPALISAIEVFAANGVTVMRDQDRGFTPTPVISHAILTHNRGRSDGLADGVVITPSHNPPEDGGFKYNPPRGGPAGTDATSWIEKRANALIAAGLAEVKRMPFPRALHAETTHAHDFITPYVADLGAVIDMEVIHNSGVRIGIDPLGGAAVHYWPHIIQRYRLDATVVNDTVDPSFRFMTLDWDAKIRMDCSSPYAMASLVAMADRFDIAFANDTDADRHGIVCPGTGLLAPNPYLAVCIDYLFAHRPGWGAGTGIGKTIVSSAMIDRVARAAGRAVLEVPVGFKWFVDGLIDGSLGFVGEESAGASFLRRDGTVWTTDKDGLIAGLLAAEMTARTGHSPAAAYRRLTETLGASSYERIDAPATPAQKDVLKKLSPAQLNAQILAGDVVTGVVTEAPGNKAPIGGIKVSSAEGWYAARPSGTENVYKIYAESFRGPAHLAQIQQEAQAVLGAAFAAAGC